MPPSSSFLSMRLHHAADRAQLLWVTARPLVLAVGFSVLLVLARSAVFLWWEQAGAGLRPFTALLASLFLVLTVAALAASLIETGGGNPELFLVGHVRLAREYVYDEPLNSRRELATDLVGNGIRYARADYWTAYATTFLSREHVVVASTDFARITAYQDLVDAHRAEAVMVQTSPCERAGGAEAIPGMYWVCRE